MLYHITDIHNQSKHILIFIYNFFIKCQDINKEFIYILRINLL